MGKSSKRKKLFHVPDNCEVKLEHHIDFSRYDIIDVREDSVLVRRKDTGEITIMLPVARWEIDDILSTHGS